MAALTAGTQAPDFSLPTLDGKTFSLRKALERGPVLAVFFKISCPVCQYAAPFVDRLHQTYGHEKVTIIGVSQDDAQGTQAFMREFGASFPVALDDPRGYAISNAYGLTNVPSLFLIGSDGEIEVSSVGWSKPDFEAINAKLAAAQNAPPQEIFKLGEEVRDFRAG